MGHRLCLHVVYTFPFAFLVMLAIFNRFDASVEEASWSLGVSPITTFRKVTFPLIFPGVLSAMLFAFTLSYDEFSRTLFSSGRELTLPLAIYGTFSVEIHPNMFAFGVLTTLFSFALLAVYAILMTLSVRRARRVAIQEAIAMKTAIVTGAGSGIGRAVAMRLAGDGYRVTVNDIVLDQAESVAARNPKRAAGRPSP